MTWDSILQGELRKRWTPHFLGDKRHPMLEKTNIKPIGGGDDLSTKMQSELEKLKIETEKHLKVPQIQTKAPYRKTTLFFMFLGVLFLGVLFFIAGFMVCFSLFPPQYQTVAAVPQVGPISGQPSYLVRQDHIVAAAGGAPRDGLLTQIEKQSMIAAQRRTQEAIASTTDRINAGLRNTMGYRIESVLEPVTKGIAGFLIGTVGDPEATGMVYNNEQSREMLSPRVSPGVGENPPSRDHQSPSIGSQAIEKGVGPSNRSLTSPRAEAGTGEAAQGDHTATSLQVAQKREESRNALSLGNQGLYAVEISHYSQSQDAYVQMRDLINRGYDAYIVRVIEEGHLFYSLRFGDFKSYQDAQEAVKGFRSLWNQPARVMITTPQDDRMRFR